MNKNMMIHESALGTLLDFIDTIKSRAESETKYKSNSPMRGETSIAKATSDLTLVFPVVCSKGISIDNASMVTKALEKNFVTMIQQLLAANNITNVKDVKSYIKSFHDNLDSSVATLDDLFRLTESVEYITPTDRAAAMNDMKNINFVLPTSINETALTDYTVREGAVDQKAYTNMLKDNKSAADYFSKQVLDTDYKKANDLMPTMVTVSFNVDTESDAGLQNYGNALIGVKAKLYPIASDDVVKHISEKNDSRNWVTNFFRATTREISFLKDFVLALDKAKIDAQSFSARGNSTSDKMWKVLERRATNSRINRLMRNNNSGAAAITTLCVSQEEVEYLKKHHSVDLENLRVISGLFESLNLICICIVDESLEVAKFAFDTNDPSWETVSFAHMEREASDNTYKRVVNLMTKVSH